MIKWISNTWENEILRCGRNGTHNFQHPFTPEISILVGGFNPLKNMSSSVGMMKFPIYMEK